MNRPEDSGRSQSPAFASTCWTVVIEAAGSKNGEEALGLLCQAYWRPVYAFVRSRGHQAADAEDLTQEFFTQLIKTRSFKSADPQKGRFRFFLLGALKHFLANEFRRGQRLKRGGGVRVVSLNETMESEEYPAAYESGAVSSDPEFIYDKRWGETLVAIVFDRLREEFDRKGKARHYSKLIVHLSDSGNDESYQQTADDLGISLSAAKSAIHRLRQRYGFLFREEVARTVAHQSDIEDELRYLIERLSG
jgi:RNA polymerase sigma-70 factor (ECF subfamily)